MTSQSVDPQKGFVGVCIVVPHGSLKRLTQNATSCDKMAVARLPPAVAVTSARGTVMLQISLSEEDDRPSGMALQVVWRFTAEVDSGCNEEWLPGATQRWAGTRLEVFKSCDLWQRLVVLQQGSCSMLPHDEELAMAADDELGNADGSADAPDDQGAAGSADAPDQGAGSADAPDASSADAADSADDEDDADDDDRLKLPYAAWEALRPLRSWSQHRVGRGADVCVGHLSVTVDGGPRALCEISAQSLDVILYGYQPYHGCIDEEAMPWDFAIFPSHIDNV